ncbi:MAG: anti-sigma factor [Acidobacteriota bacterium]|nr:anti-sigma factor [Acidobacteriota bacterium]
MTCKMALRGIQDYLDDGLSGQETIEMDRHLEDCSSCRQALDEFRALQQMMRKLDRQPPPPDLELRIRVAASLHGERISLKRLVNELGDLMNPLAVPAFSGVFLTCLTFIVLLSTLFSGASLGSGDPDSALGLFTEPRARSLTMMPVVFGADLPFVTQPVTVRTLVGEDGRVIDYTVLSGPRDKRSLQFLDRFLYFGVNMDPATFLGRPTVGTFVMTLSFYPTTQDRIDVRG